MMNVEQITSRLSQMPDQALQKYAMMHKEDPYIMALAISESRRRKQMRAAASAPQPQAQPKVADRALMEMGVDALPTQEMDFASGGIVAFADGGDVERYNGSTGSLTGGSFFAQLDQDKATRLAQLNAQLEQINPMLIAATRSGDQRVIQQYAQQAQAIRDQINAVRESAGNRIGGIEALMAPKAAPESAPAAPTMPAGQFNRMPGAEQLSLPVAPPAAPTASVASARDDTFRRQTDPRMLGVPAAPPAPKAEDKGLGATPEAEALRKTAAKPPAPATKPTAPAVTEPAAPNVENAKELAEQFYDTKAQKAEVEKYIKEQKDAVEKARERREEGKPKGEAYSKYEQMLLAEGAKSGKERDDALSVAILQLGIGMMGGTSPNAFKNISDAAGPALGQYTSALKDLKKADKERQKALADIENARRAEARDDWKAKNEFEEKAEARMDAARKYGIEFIKDVSGKGGEISGKIYDRQVAEQGLFRRTQMEQEGLDRRARQAAAARPFDIDGEYAKAVLAGDKPRAAALLEVIQNRAAARKPGLDETQLNAFTKANEKLFEQLRLEKNMATTNPAKYKAQYEATLANLRNAATARGLDPNSIPDLATGGSAVDSSLLNRADRIVGGGKP